MKKLLTICALVAGVLTSIGAFAQTTPQTPAQAPKILVAYYSYSGNTKDVAEAMHRKVGGDIFEIKAEGTYPDSYRPMTEQAKQEIASGYRPRLLTSIDNIAQYDIVFIGSPDWWGTITPQVSSFLDAYDMSGKRVIPFITAGSGAAQRTISDMTKQCKDCDVEQNGWVGYGNNMQGLDAWIEQVLK